MVRSIAIVLFLGPKNLLISMFFNRRFISFFSGQKIGFRSCVIKIKNSYLFNQQGVCLYFFVRWILVPIKISLQSILPDNIKFIAFNEMLLPV